MAATRSGSPLSPTAIDESKLRNEAASAAAALRPAPRDLKRFKAITIGKPVVMGRKTFDSIGKPLPGRPNIVISRSEALIDGATVTPGLGAALEKAASLVEGDNLEICVIGGGEIYRHAMERADRLEITHVEGRVDGDTVFPTIDPDVWALESEERISAGERDSHDMRFAVYRRSI